MESVTKGLRALVWVVLVISPVFSQNEIRFGEKKINIPGNEICSYTVNKNSHLTKCFLEIKNGKLLYTSVEYDQGNPVRVEIMECKMEDLDKSSCSLGSSDQKSAYTPGLIYIIYLYTTRDQVSISNTLYATPDGPANIEHSSVGRIHFRNYDVALDIYENFFK